MLQPMLWQPSPHGDCQVYWHPQLQATASFR